MADVQQREATLADLEAHAYELRAMGVQGIRYYIYGDGPGVIRRSRREPEGVSCYVIYDPKGRIWTIRNAD